MQKNHTLKQIKRRDQILTQNLWKTIIVLTIPLALYQVFNYLYDFIDLYLAAGIASSNVNSVVFISEIKNATIAFGAAIAAAGSVMVARNFGANNIKKAKKYAACALFLALVVSAFMAIVMIVFGETIMTAFGADETVISSGMTYYNYQILTTAVMAVVSVFIGLEKAKGNTKLILYLNLGAMALKLSLSFVFVKVLNGDLASLALSTLIGQTLFALVGLWIMFSKNNILALTLKTLRPSRKMALEIIILAIPIFLGKFLFNMGKVVINGLALNYHPDAVGALGITYKIHGLFGGIANSFEETNLAVVSQNAGAKNIKRARSAFFVSLTYAIGIASIGIMIMWNLQDFVISMFETTNLDKIQIIKDIYVFEQFSVISSAVIIVSLSFFIAFKKSIVAFIINIVRIFVLRLPVLWFLYEFVKPRTHHHIGWVMFFSNTTTAIIVLTMALLFNRSLRVYREPQLNDSLTQEE